MISQRLAKLPDGAHEVLSFAAVSEILDESADAPRNYFWMTVTQVHAEVAVGIGRLDHCRRLFDELLPFRGHLGITASGSLCFGFVSRSLGALALALGHPTAAVDFLDEAVRQADQAGARCEAVIARRLLATALRASAELKTSQLKTSQPKTSEHTTGSPSSSQRLVRPRSSTASLES